VRVGLAHIPAPLAYRVPRAPFPPILVTPPALRALPTPPPSPWAAHALPIALCPCYKYITKHQPTHMCLLCRPTKTKSNQVLPFLIDDDRHSQTQLHSHTHHGSLKKNNKTAVLPFLAAFPSPRPCQAHTQIATQTNTQSTPCPLPTG